MRILVTGGAGFIGSHLVRHILDDASPLLPASEVVVFDKLTYAGNKANLAPVWADSRLTFVQADICDAEPVRRAIRDIDLVVHCAAESHVDRSIENADAFVRTNVLGTQTLLQAAVDAGVGRFVHVSTDEVYGSVAHGSWTEGEPVRPRSPYAASKAASDLLALAFHTTHALDVCVTRCSNNYGPYQHPEKAIPRFISNLLDGIPLPLYGDGRNRRDWLHVGDHCRALALVATKGTAGRVYNIGGGTELANNELVDRVLAECGKGWDMVRRVPDRKGHDARYSVDFSRIGEELGYEPRTAFADGLSATVSWYRDNPRWWRPLTGERSGA
ncbi:dTDP-glucose 4,6-dehydratase [Streptomyces profundus]|uniref:dTDP-glucose 4,6-dehydratase n=1 Tax=Streptomyces profundus TaxID=2867410 RepID=UPI001D16ABB9|nr:dTDP-glucose 4,6-dehydratase [Streptomyces sp. MA3_2.13]UED83231.1 dTDP-glucose 4,6-dehydratase [Streptomyces sp. MA3_2.13]